MGRESKVARVRHCLNCQESIYADAQDLQDHADQCRRLKALGLITPRIILDRPGLTITRGD